MNVAPVIERELRVEARSSLCLWLRILSSGGMILVMTIVMQRQEQLGHAELGNLLFNFLNRTLLGGILVIAPLLTADCISRERREGTLGLLFLTPLKAHEVVWAKVTIQMLRALVLVLSALPVMGLPFLLGGVTVEMGIQAAFVQFSALLMGLAAGLLASVKNVEWIPSVVKAELLGGAAAFVLRDFLLGGFNGRWWAFLPGFVVALIFFVAVIRSATEKVREHSSGETGIQQPSVWVGLFANSDFWRDIFHWDKGPTLDKNPIAWLQEYSWSARLAKWGWVVLVLVLVVAGSFASHGGDIFISPIILNRLMLLVATGMAFTATASFRRERENGALELLLVTPLTPAQLIGGRLWGVFCHFFPVGAVLAVFWLFELGSGSVRHSQALAAFHSLSTIINVPVIGLAVSLLRLNFILAWLITCMISYALPSLVMAGFGMYWQPRGAFSEPSQLFLFVVAQVLLGFWIVRSLNRKLTDRTFAFAGG